LEVARLASLTRFDHRHHLAFRGVFYWEKPMSVASLPKQSDILAYRSVYGDPRSKRNSAVVSPTWYGGNMVRVIPPFRMTYAGQRIPGLMFHKAAAPHFDHWGVSITGGSFNYRLMRGLNTLSMHSFGCALDLDPARNGLGDATPRFKEFPEVMKAFKASGLCWGGDWDGDGSSADQRRHDGMHLQATRPIQ
jgi:hypothetical protein